MAVLRWVACGVLAGVAAPLVWALTQPTATTTWVRILAVAGLVLAAAAVVRGRGVAILAGVVFAIAATVALVGAFAPAPPELTAEQLLGIGLPADLRYSTALLLAGCVVPLVLLAVADRPAGWHWNQRAQVAIAAGLVVAVAGSVVALRSGDPLADGAAARIAGIEVDSTTVRGPGRTPNWSGDGPSPESVEQLWAKELPNGEASRLVPGDLLVSPIDGGVSVRGAEDGTERWHYRITDRHADTSIAIDLEPRRVAVVSGVAVVVLALDSGDVVDRFRLPGDPAADRWLPVTDKARSVPVSYRDPTPLRAVGTIDGAATVIGVDLYDGTVTDIDRAPGRNCEYVMATDPRDQPAMGPAPAIVRDGCGPPQIIRFDDGGVEQRTTVPLIAPDDQCAVDCTIHQGPQWFNGTVVLALSHGPNHAPDIVVVGEYSLWRYQPADDHFGYAVLPLDDHGAAPVARLAVATAPGTCDLLDLSLGTPVANSVPIPGNTVGYETVASTDDGVWWYWLVRDGTGNRLVAVETTTLQQVDTGIRLPPGTELHGGADGRLLISDHDRVFVVA
jgi:hypothetical protein